jgi:hypothetical protein
MDVQSGFAGVTDSQVRQAHTWDRVIEETESAHVKRARARPPKTDLVVGTDGLREIARQSLWPDAPIPGAPTTRPGGPSSLSGSPAAMGAADSARSQFWSHSLQSAAVHRRPRVRVRAGHGRW